MKNRKSPECGSDAKLDRAYSEQRGDGQEIANQHPTGNSKLHFHYVFLSKSVRPLLSLAVTSKRVYRRKPTFFIRLYPTLALAIQSPV